MNILDTLFSRRSRRLQAGTADAITTDRRRRHRLGQGERLERRALAAIDSVVFTAPGDFFLDASKGPLIDSQYASYRIDYSGASYADVWLKLTNDVGDVIQRGLYEDGLYHVGPLNGSGTAMAYLYFTASGVTNIAQTHTVQLFNGKPDDAAVNSTAISGPLNCTYNSVYDVVSANDSKITSVFLSPAAPGPIPVGSTMTMTVLGQLGQADQALFTPSSRADWNADAYELRSTKILIDGALQPSDQIFYSTLPGGNTQQQTTAIYEFRIADVTGTTIAEPSQFTKKGGGSPFKNDETSVTAICPSSINVVTVQKLADGLPRSVGTPLVVSDTGATVTFSLRFTNTSTTLVVLDAIQDTLPAGMTYTGNFTGIATFMKQGGTAVNLSPPVVSSSGATLTWTNPYSPANYTNFGIEPGTYADLTFQVVMPTTTGSYVNSSIGRIGKVVIDTTLNTTDLVPATAWVRVSNAADLSITKTNIPSTTIVAGESLTYQLIVTNTGPKAANGATVFDDFPAEFLNATWTATYFGNATGAGTGIGDINTPVNLPKNGSALFTIYGLVAADTAATLISNTATITAPSDVFDDNLANNSSTVTNICVRKGDLSITKTTQGLMDEMLVAGQTYTYKLVVSNSGTSTAVGATVYDQFPTVFLGASWTTTFSGSGATAANASGSGTQLNTTATIPAGATVTFYVTGVLQSDTAVTQVFNAANVTAPANFIESTTTNNFSSVTDICVRKGDLSITKTTQGLMDEMLVAGQTYTYKLVVSNSGTSTAVGATVYDQFPTVFLGASWTTTFSGSGATAANASGSGTTLNTTATIPAGGNVTFYVTGVLQSDTAVTQVFNAANVTAPANFIESTTTNNFSSVTNGTTRQADLSISKTPKDGTYVGGDTITYTITVSNLGPVTIPASSSIVVTDVLPTGISFVTTPAGWNYDPIGNTGTFSLSGLAANTSQTFTLAIKVNGGRGGELVNKAIVGVPMPAGFIDPNLSNNTSTSTYTEPLPPASVQGFLVIGTDDGCNGPLPTRVRVIDAQDGGREVIPGGFVPYPDWKGSVRVATGDLNGDGIDEIITAPGRGRVGEIRVFEVVGNTAQWLTSYRSFPFGPTYRGGLEVAVGRLNTDIFGDIIAGQSTGAGFVRGFLTTGTNGTSIATSPYRSFRGFPSPYNAGIKLTSADLGSYVNSTWTPGVLDGISEIVVGSNSGIRATVRVWDVNATPRVVRTILPFAANYRGGVTLATGRYNSDIVPDIFVGAGIRGSSQLEIWSVTGSTPTKLAVFAGMVKPNASLFTAGLDINGDGIVDNIYGVQGQHGYGGTLGVRDYPVGATGTATQLVLTNNSNFAPPLRIAPLRLGTLLARRRPL
ncbi:MAG: hypothetical protein ACKOEX_12885 [Planctomycetia bacterium]